MNLPSHSGLYNRAIDGSDSSRGLGLDVRLGLILVVVMPCGWIS